MATGTDVQVLGRLLRDELAAIETYDLALKNDAQVPQRWSIHELAQEHRQSASALERALRQSGGIADMTPRAQAHEVWGTLQRAPSTKLIDDRNALETLRSCEEWEIGQCRIALAKNELDPSIRTLISSRLLPNLEDHVTILNGYLDRKRQGA